MTVRVIGCETTGTDLETAAIIEIASVDVLADGAIANRQSTLVRPGVPIPAEASAVHHLLDADLAGAPPLMDVVEMSRGPRPEYRRGEATRRDCAASPPAQPRRRSC